MLDLTNDPALAREIVRHAFATKYVTIAGFTALIWDHMCTFDDEVRYMWSAPTSIVKALFLGNRYITPLFQVLTLIQLTRPAGFSNMYCKVWNLANGFAEIASMASLDLLLLYRLHALWSGRRQIVVGTYVLYFVAYACLTGSGVKAAIELTPHVHYSELARMCSSDYRPRLMSVLWSFALVSELIVFVMTAIKAFKERKAHEINTPLIKCLYRDQFFYYIIIMLFRAFNLAIWNFLPPSLLYLGVFFIWAIVTALVSRIMLNLRRVASTKPQTGADTFFGETVYSTRIVWARHELGENATYDSRTVVTPPDDDEFGDIELREREMAQAEVGSGEGSGETSGEGAEGIQLRELVRRDRSQNI